MFCINKNLGILSIFLHMFAMPYAFAHLTEREIADYVEEQRKKYAEVAQDKNALNEQLMEAIRLNIEQSDEGRAYIKELIKNGADPNFSPNEQEPVPLESFAANAALSDEQKKDLIENFIAHGADPSIPARITPPFFSFARIKNLFVTDSLYDRYPVIKDAYDEQQNRQKRYAQINRTLIAYVLTALNNTNVSDNVTRAALKNLPKSCLQSLHGRTFKNPHAAAIINELLAQE